MSTEKKYNDYKKSRIAEEKKKKANVDGQMELFDFIDG